MHLEYIMSFEVLVSENKITFVDDKGRAEGFELSDKMTDIDSVNSIKNEQKAARVASVGALSLLCNILKSPRIDGYKGTCPANEPVANELKAAIRELEIEHIKPVFCDGLIQRGMTAGTVEKHWQEYATGLKSGGSYANAKSAATQYFAICGKLPETDSGKLISIAALKKLVQIEKDKVSPEAKKTVADKLVDLKELVNNRTEALEMGSPVVALIALNELRAVFEGLNREAVEAAAVIYEHQVIGNVNDAADKVIAKVMEIEALV
jgi:hypothetical protein